jgi:hypothetical protein
LFQQERRPATNNQQQKFQRGRKAMKTNLVRMAVLVVVAVTMAAPAFAGQAQSEQGTVLRQDMDPESGMVWRLAPAKETGNLPADNARQLKSESGAKTGVPSYEIGGIVYRIGIDTP